MSRLQHTQNEVQNVFEAVGRCMSDFRGMVSEAVTAKTMVVARLSFQKPTIASVHVSDTVQA